MFRFLTQFIAASLLWGCLSIGTSAVALHGAIDGVVVHAMETERQTDSTSRPICETCHVFQHVTLANRCEFLMALAAIHFPFSGNERAASRLLSPEGPPPEVAIA